MTMFHQLRPWGDLDWVLGHLPGKRWSLLGAVSTEDRCLATLDTLKGCDGRSRFLAIIDPDPLDKTLFISAIENRKKEVIALGVRQSEVVDVKLMAGLDDIEQEVLKFLEKASSDIVLDISSMPKRWFFPVLKFMLSDARVENLHVSYASPLSYGEILSENPEPIRMLPGFSGDGGTEYESVIVGIGFEPLGVPNLFTELQINRLRLMFPFPPGPPAFMRNWMFVKLIEEMTEAKEIDTPDRVSLHLYDCPQIFDALREMTDTADRTSVFAPYGPKPMSLAMCLYSLAASEAFKRPIPVYYSQPRRYAPDYSSGVRGNSAYCIKLSGRNLYAL